MTQPRGIVRSGLTDQIYEALVDHVLDLSYAPGERLVIDQIAREMGVSPTPVRDALTRMAGEGFIEATPFRGFTVLPVPSADEIQESFEARTVVETAAIRLACARRTDAQVEELRRIQQGIATQLVGRPSKTYAPFDRLNRRFHEIFVGASGNRFLLDAHRAIDHDARMARTMYGRDVPDLSNIIAEHDAIIEAFAARDADRAASAITRHNTEGSQRVLAVLHERAEES